MKNIVLFLFITFFSCRLASAQDFKLLYTDPQDVTNPANLDIKTVSYFLDHDKDSVWFKIETYNQAATNNDENLTIVIDGNLDPTDGKDWYKLNKSMKYDRILYISRCSEKIEQPIRVER